MHNTRHNQTLCDLAYGYTNNFKLQTSAPPPKKESKRLSFMPSQTLSTKQSEVVEFGTTRLHIWGRVQKKYSAALKGHRSM